MGFDIDEQTYTELLEMMQGSERIKTVLSSYMLNSSAYELVSYQYNEKHRHYHTMRHIESMIIQLDKNYPVLSQYDKTCLEYAIIYHDVVYNPKSNTNEEDSVKFFKTHYKGDYIEEISKLIMSTKDHKSYDEISKILIELDLAILKAPIKKQIQFEDDIFKEYQWVPYNIYKEERIKVLTSLGASNELITYVRYRYPKIGIFIGSFNPFHIGHANILEKAEKIFDKVVIARGQNPDKVEKITEFPTCLEFRETHNFDGLFTDFYQTLEYDATLIRGVRNEADFLYEKTQSRYINDLDRDLQIIFIMCDAEYEHVSSSAIRQLISLGKEEHVNELYLPYTI